MSTPVVFWFRRDLRLADQPALARAAEAGPVLGTFVFDPSLWMGSGANRQAFLFDSVRSLDRKTGGQLAVSVGDPATELARHCAEVGAAMVVATTDFGPYGLRRDREVGQKLKAHGVRLELVDSPYAVPPGSVTTGKGDPYRVFTPFYRAWERHGWPSPSGPVEVHWCSPPSSPVWPDRPQPTASELPTAGEEAAWAQAERFLDHAVDNYHDLRDLPGVDGTSRLSPYLKLGTLHPRQLLGRLESTGGAGEFRRQLAWRDFYAEVLHHRPDSARRAYRKELAGMELDSGAEADERFAAWAEGRTGYPIVDAGMRQLVTEGWMHNRVRMLVASFLVKDLHLDWTRGARFFMQHLVDGDLASNSHGWQWVAGVGTDAAPYFRVFNPVSQSQKFDPTGTYIRRWVPELGLLSDRTIHAPWTEKNGAPAAYPAPLVDHGMERKEALARYHRLRGSSS